MFIKIVIQVSEERSSNRVDPDVERTIEVTVADDMPKTLLIGHTAMMSVDKAIDEYLEQQTQEPSTETHGE